MDPSALPMSLHDRLVELTTAHEPLPDDLLVRSGDGVVTIAVHAGGAFSCVVEKLGTDIVHVRRLKNSTRHDVPHGAYEYFPFLTTVALQHITVVDDMLPRGFMTIDDQMLTEYRKSQLSQHPAPLDEDQPAPDLSDKESEPDEGELSPAPEAPASADPYTDEGAAEEVNPVAPDAPSVDDEFEPAPPAGDEPSAASVNPPVGAPVEETPGSADTVAASPTVNDTATPGPAQAPAISAAASLNAPAPEQAPAASAFPAPSPAPAPAGAQSGQGENQGQGARSLGSEFEGSGRAADGVVESAGDVQGGQDATAVVDGEPMYGVLTREGYVAAESVVCDRHFDDFAGRGLAAAQRRPDVAGDAEYVAVATSGVECIGCVEERAVAARRPVVPPKPARGGSRRSSGLDAFGSM